MQTQIEESGWSDDRIIVRELSHRLKNVLTMVQGVARQSLKYAPGLAEFGQAFEARLASLARAHSLLSRSQWLGVCIHPLLTEQLAAFDESQIRLKGPNALLSPDAAYVIALLVHELSVNALKHGALGTPGGRASLAWTIDVSGEWLDFEWRESGGPIVYPPLSTGFGTELFRGLASQHRNDIGIHFESSGVVCKLRVPS